MTLKCLLSLTTGKEAGFDSNTKGEVVGPLNHVMHNPFIALKELCVLGGQDYFCLEENVVITRVAQDNRNRSNQESKFDFLATGQQLENCPHQPTIKLRLFLPINFLPLLAPPYVITVSAD